MLLEPRLDQLDKVFQYLKQYMRSYNNSRLETNSVKR